MQSIESIEVYEFVEQGQAERAQLQTCRVLLIDDDPDIIRALQACVNNPGISFTVARNAGYGIAAFMSDTFHFVLMDVLMPQMDGYAATRAIRTWEDKHRRPWTPIGAFTAAYHVFDNMLSSGFTFHLQKPTDREALWQIVHKYGPRSV
jgi:two-component system sensor histidine kinase/response regulator